MLELYNALSFIEITLIIILIIILITKGEK
jgi:hypothetical protein